MDLSLFDCRYHNDDTGCNAYDPKILLKIVLFAYSRGVIGSRRIEWLCRNHMICMALACLQCPDHSAIAAFVSSMHQEVLSLFRDILLVCDEQQLLGGTVFALDGLKLSSNASKQWSGTVDELKHKQEKLEAKLRRLIQEHQEVDAGHQERIAIISVIRTSTPVRMKLLTRIFRTAISGNVIPVSLTRSATNQRRKRGRKHGLVSRILSMTKPRSVTGVPMGNCCVSRCASIV